MPLTLSRNDEGNRVNELDQAILTDHAREQMAKRGISESQVRSLLGKPCDRRPVRPGRIMVQGMISVGAPPVDYLLRVFLDVDRSPPEVVTSYRTSKIDKYRSSR